MVEVNLLVNVLALDGQHVLTLKHFFVVEEGIKSFYQLVLLLFLVRAGLSLVHIKHPFEQQAVLGREQRVLLACLEQLAWNVDCDFKRLKVAEEVVHAFGLESSFL